MKKKEIIVRQAQRILELEAQLAAEPVRPASAKPKLNFGVIEPIKFIRNVVPEVQLVHAREIVATVLELATLGEWKLHDEPLTDEGLATIRDSIRKGILDSEAARQKIAG